MLARILVPASTLLVSMSFVFACSESATPETPLEDAATDAPSIVPDGATTDAAPDAPAPIVEVHGKLLDWLDQPLAGFKVATAVMTAPVTTAADGTFTVMAPAPSYDLVITSTKGDHVFVIAGLTRLDPIVPLNTTTAPRAYATFSGTIPAITSGQGAQVIFVPSDGKSRYADYNLLFGPADTYERMPEWYGSGPFTGTLYLFQYEAVGLNNPASTFLGWSKIENLTIAKDETKTANFPATTSVTTNSITGAMTVPANWKKGGSLFSFMRLQGTKARLTVNQTTSPDLTFSMPMPVFDQAIYGIAFRANGPLEGEQTVVRKVIALGATANVTMPAAAVLTAPAEGATGIDESSALSWTKTDGISYVMAYSTEGAAVPIIHVITAGASTKLPNLATLGVTIPAAKKYEWFVVGYPTVASVDALATGGNFDWFCTPYSPLGNDETTCTFSSVRSFVTK